MSKGNRWLNETVEERFDRYVIPEPNSGCFLWLGSTDRRGYGQLRLGKRKLKFASHIALEIAGRPVPSGSCALHKCDNPACVNADHLFVGTQLDNITDMHAKGRADLSGLTLGHGHNRLTDEVMSKLRDLYENGTSGSAAARLLGINKTTTCRFMRMWRAEDATA